MKTILALAPLAVALSACVGYPGRYESPQGPQDYPQQGPYTPPPTGPYQPAGDYKAVGTEPFWDLTIGRELVFNDGGNGVRVTQPTPPVRNGFAGEMYETPRIRVNIVHAECSDGMSDRRFPDKVQVWVDGRPYEGCGAAASFYTSTDERGDPIAPLPAGPAPQLDRTNWRVIAINGRQTPTKDFYFNFQPDRIGAKFGCNTLGAGFSVNGNVLSAGAIMATRMACPDMSFEDAGSRVMSLPMTVTGNGPRLTLSNANGSIELVRAH